MECCISLSELLGSWPNLTSVVESWWPRSEHLNQTSLRKMIRIQFQKLIKAWLWALCKLMGMFGIIVCSSSDCGSSLPARSTFFLEVGGKYTLPILTVSLINHLVSHACLTGSSLLWDVNLRGGFFTLTYCQWDRASKSGAVSSPAFLISALILGGVIDEKIMTDLIPTRAFSIGMHVF